MSSKKDAVAFRAVAAPVGALLILCVYPGCGNVNCRFYPANSVPKKSVDAYLMRNLSIRRNGEEAGHIINR
ncbi:MAG: hypothetical protein JXD23_01915 [Spirochaetales bacterium]|nr:hypothetical protein [Spirochaetales bacterium]